MVWNAWSSFVFLGKYDVMKCFVLKLKRLKQTVAEWEKEMKKRMGLDLDLIDMDIQLIFLQSPTGILLQEDTLVLLDLKDRKEHLLADDVLSWW